MASQALLHWDIYMGTQRTHVKCVYEGFLKDGWDEVHWVNHWLAGISSRQVDLWCSSIKKDGLGDLFSLLSVHSTFHPFINQSIFIMRALSLSLFIIIIIFLIFSFFLFFFFFNSSSFLYGAWRVAQPNVLNLFLKLSRPMLAETRLRLGVLPDK